MYEFRPPEWPDWKTAEKIGQGSFGVVYRLERVMFGDLEEAALKYISIPRDPGEIDELRAVGDNTESITASFHSQMESYANEYRLLKKLDGCPNVVRVDDVRCVQHSDNMGWDVLIKMELLTPLLKYLSREQHTDEELAVGLGKDMCRALAECARHKILHRDIKPQNIFAAPNGTFKLGDFGIARIKERTSTATERVGTNTYMAPEVYSGSHYGAAADIYSLGLVLYWLLNERRVPFAKDTTVSQREEAIRRRMSGEELPAPAHGSEELKRIVLKACAHDPKDRYQSAEEMLRDLEVLSTSTEKASPVEAPDNAADAPVSRKPDTAPKKKNTWTIPVIAAAIVILAILLWLKARDNGSASGSQTGEAPVTTQTSTSTPEPTPEPSPEPTPGPTPTPSLTPSPTPTPTPIPSPTATPATKLSSDTVTVGSIITFGRYEQDNNESNGAEPIEWLVLAKEGNRILVISRYALEGQQYNKPFSNITWATSALHKWLNGAFMKKAFNETEQLMILTVTVNADKNPSFKTNPGKSTKDKLFLLSIKEANTYFTSNWDRMCQTTTYSEAKCHGYGSYCIWWLRSPGERSSDAAYVTVDGNISYHGIDVGNDFGVRPALWIDLD